MKVYCPDCGAQIPAEDLNLETLLARCRKCNSVFSFADAARAETGRSAARVASSEVMADLPCPPRIQVQESPAAWSARWRWFSPAAIFMALFCVVWDGFLIFWYSVAFTTHAPWIMVIFPILHVAVGVSLTYATLATFLNSTQLQATRGDLSIRSGPLPWIGNRSLPASAVRQIFYRAAYNSNRNGLNMGYGNRYGPATFGLFAVLATGRTVRLVGGLKDTDEAMFLQRHLEQRLNVKPTPAP